MATSSTRVEAPGLGRLLRALHGMTGKLGDLRDAHQKAGQIVVTAAGGRAPRRSGRLAGSGQADGATITFHAPWAGPIHYGWPARGIEAQPFAVEAAMSTEAQWLDAYSDGVDDAVDDVTGRTY